MLFKQTATLSASGAGATISTTEAGYLPGMRIPVLLHSPGGAFSGSAILQTSQDGTTWATATGATAVTTGGTDVQNITLQQFIRLNCTAYTSGNIRATLIADI